MRNKKFLVIVTGSIAAYKAASLVSFLSKENIVKVMMTKSATKFITPLTFQTLSKQSVLTDMFDKNEPNKVSHIYYSQEYDCIIVAPATANIIGKMANGIADDLASSTLIAATKPIILVPSMNTHMLNNPITQKNLKTITFMTNTTIVEPKSGMLACGTEGCGAYPDTRTIVERIETVINTSERI